MKARSTSIWPHTESTNKITTQTCATKRTQPANLWTIALITCAAALLNTHASSAQEKGTTPTIQSPPKSTRAKPLVGETAGEATEKWSGKAVEKTAAQPNGRKGGTQNTPPSSTSNLDSSRATRYQPPTPTSNTRPNSNIRLRDEQALVEEKDAVTTHEEPRSSWDPYEDPNDTYWFAGAIFRYTIIPRFVQQLFLDTAPSTAFPSIGAEVTYRKNGFSLILGLHYTDMSANGPFRIAGDPTFNTEYIDSDMSLISGTVSMMWSTAFNDVFSFDYGVGIGLGVVNGGIQRTEAYPSTDEGSANGYARCAGPSDPNAIYCEDEGNYGSDIKKWSSGGFLPNILPWLALPQFALRIKPIHQLAIRIEASLGLGFTGGISAAYGF